MTPAPDISGYDYLTVLVCSANGKPHCDVIECLYEYIIAV